MLKLNCASSIAAAMLLAATALTGCGADTQGGLPAAGVIDLSEEFTGDYALIDANGAPVTPESFAGDVAILYFGFASCPDVCPLALGRLTGALNELDAGTLADVTPVFITVDPERDTPEALAAFLSFDERIIGVTGAPDAIEAAKRAFKVYAAKEALPESELGYTVNHTSFFYLVDREGRPRVALKDSLTPEEIAEALRRAVRWR
ncbi:MAG: SCO family protein [Pseudomonadota bacterium]